MAQTNFTPISLYYSTTAAAVPTAGNLVAGELAINTQDGKLFYKDAAGVVQTLASKDTNSGTFTNISVSGVASFADGTVSLPSITNIGDTNTGMYFPAADTIAFTEGGAESMRIDSAGRLGIGTASPATRLDVVSSTNTPAQFQSSGTTSAYLQMTNTGGGGYVATNNNDLVFATSGSADERMRIDSSGNVQIATTSNFGRFTVLPGNGSYFAVTTSSGAGGGAGGWQLPAYYGSVKMNYIDCELENGSSGSEASVMRFATIGSGTLTERMRIDSSGNVLVNTTGSTGHKMTVQSAAGAGGIDCVGGATNGYYAMRVDMPSTNTYGVLFRNNGNNVGDIRINSSTTTYNTSSDYRLKEDIAPMTGALDKVSALKPVTYKWKSTGEESQGFIAHELAEVVPDCVTGEKDGMRTEQYEVTPAIEATYDEEGNELTPAVEAVMGEREVPEYQGIDTSFLVATLTAAIQELKAELDSVKAELQTLKGN
jgi:hypothetical protein